ncbi:unnamed protein product, partial [Allacma fusca]
SVVRSLNLKQGPTFFRISLEIFNGKWKPNDTPADGVMLIIFLKPNNHFIRQKLDFRTLTLTPMMNKHDSIKYVTVRLFLFSLHDD